MSAPLPADAAHAAASGPCASDHDALYRRIGMRIVPFLFVCYIVSILDRSNIGFAQLQMRQDLGLTDAMYSLGAVLFFVGYVLFEVPHKTRYIFHRVQDIRRDKHQRGSVKPQTAIPSGPVWCRHAIPASRQLHRYHPTLRWMRDPAR